MASSGHQSDAQFASGFLNGLAERIDTFAGGDGHWRPRANLEVPYGRVDGDVAFGCRLSNFDGDTLVIVEREGSGPGNERNILKWYQATESRADIYLVNGGNTIQRNWSSVILMLAFARPAGWSASDFGKTVGFCRLLGDLINRNSNLTVIVEAWEGAAEDWQLVGEYHGRKLVERLKQSG